MWKQACLKLCVGYPVLPADVKQTVEAAPEELLEVLGVSGVEESTCHWC